MSRSTVHDFMELRDLGDTLNTKATVYLAKLASGYARATQENACEELGTLNSAELYTRDAIRAYEGWLQDLEEGVVHTLDGCFDSTTGFSDRGSLAMAQEHRLRKSTEYVIQAQMETERNLSISYTHLGIINKYKGNYSESRRNYEHALTLWGRNSAALSQLRLLNSSLVDGLQSEKPYPA